MKRFETIKKFLFFGMALLLMWGMVFTYTRVTDGFSLGEIRSQLPYRAPYASKPLSDVAFSQLDTLLSQPFRYLGKGCQFYAFESADQTTVIKFFKQKHLRPQTWLSELPLPKAYSSAQIAKRKERVERLLSSCQLAYEALPEETGILYVHLVRDPVFNKKITLIDKLGLKHQIDIDQYEFVIQKKAIPVGEEFARLLKAGDHAGVAKRVEQLMQLVDSRCQKGIRDRDRSFVQNVAFCAHEDRAVFVDFGQFYRDETIKQRAEIEADLKRRLGNLHHWTGRHFPEAIPILENYLASKN